MKVKISPSILAADFANLEREAKAMAEAGADMLHIDVMDGHFVPNLSMGIPVISSLRKKTSLYFDVHLMLTDPLQYVESFAEAGADLLTFHLESDSDVWQTIEGIRALGKQVGISLKPATPPEQVYPYLDAVDLVLVMTVEPGFGGQKFMPEMLEKIEKIRAHTQTGRRSCPLDIQVDGGIDVSTASAVFAKGANVLVAGSALFSQPDYAQAVAELRRAAQPDL